MRVAELLQVPVVLLPRAEIAPETYDVRRRQHNSSLLLRQLSRWVQAIEDPASKIVGVIDEDIFSPLFTFVFGEAQLGRQAALVSVKRLKQEYYGKPRDRVLLEERLFKEMVHEVGHLLGMTHCPDRTCLMSRCADIAGLDAKRAAPCGNCWAQLRSLRAIETICPEVASFDTVSEFPLQAHC